MLSASGCSQSSLFLLPLSNDLRFLNSSRRLLRTALLSDDIRSPQCSCGLFWPARIQDGFRSLHRLRCMLQTGFNIAPAACFRPLCLRMFSVSLIRLCRLLQTAPISRSIALPSRSITLPPRRYRSPIKEHPVMCLFAFEKRKDQKKIQQSKGMNPIPQVEFIKSLTMRCQFFISHAIQSRFLCFHRLLQPQSKADFTQDYKTTRRE